MRDTAYRAVAVVGLGAVLPDAPNVEAFWKNVTAGRYSITEVRPERWDPALYYDADRNAPDKTYSKIGGWVREFAWDPLKWRLAIPPRVADAMDDAQRWGIACTREALGDYGYPERPLPAERTAVILGNAMAGEKHYLTALRAYFPEYARELDESPSFAALPEAMRRDIRREWSARLGDRLPPITEDSMPGELSNCLAGRIANVYNFRGPNFVCDAACASAMAAIHSAVEGLVENEFDVAVTGGIDRNMGASTFIKFCKIGALSGTGSRPYAEGADGFVMGEGAAILLMKRLADAERDGDKIYAVLRGMGASSDGKGKGITAPNPAGQKIAIGRAWENAGLSPATATLIEGHGTSTSVGDVVEVESITDVLRQNGVNGHAIALGSVKSNIGHLKGAAGAAGILKTVLALHHKVLPPSVRCERPNPNIDFGHSPLYVNTELKPWNATVKGVRCAAVSAFGFGGTNFHGVFEEHIPHRLTRNGRDSVAVGAAPPAVHGPAEIATSLTATEPRSAGHGGAPTGSTAKAPLRGALLIGAASVAGLGERLHEIQNAARAGRVPANAPPCEADLRAPERIAIDYGNAAELAEKCAKAARALPSSEPAVWKALRAQGIFRGAGQAPKVAFLYPGQGSQYVNMMAGLRAAEPIVARTFDEADRVMTPLLGKPLSSFIFVDSSDAAAVAQAEEDLRQTAITQPAVLATDLALTRLLEAYGLRPDFTMGHSLGEYGALVAAGALPFADALEAVSARGREMTRVSVADKGRMAAVFAPLPEVERILQSVGGYAVIANYNSEKQVVIGGATRAMEAAAAAFERAGYEFRFLPVSHAFHTEIVAPASGPMRATLERLRLEPPKVPTVANVNGGFYPMGPDARPAMLEILARQIAAPVQFIQGLRKLYEAGARVFVEVGPKKALHGFVEDVLGDRGDVLALFTNHPKLDDTTAFNQALCGLYAAGLGAARMEDVKAAGAPVVITGAALGLPGTERIFDDENVARILNGEQFIDVIPTRCRRAMLDKHVTRLVKSENGGPTFEQISHPSEVVKLAGRGRAFDLHAEFGVSAERMPSLDRVTQLAMAAGIDALRDAGIPLVMRYKVASNGKRLPDRWGLPDALRDETGVIFASVWPGWGSFADETERYYGDRARRDQLALLEDLRAQMDGAQPALRQQVDRRIADLKDAIDRMPYRLDRQFLFRVLSMGHSQFAEYIGARGPNTHVNAACASTTQAVAVAEDWIHAGRCRRVIIVSADDITTDSMLGWFGAGFLASGAAATDDVVEEAAVPFDRRRHGMIIGMGAAALVVESAAAAAERGLKPICEVLSAVAANSAFHGTRLDVNHIGTIMEKLVRQAEARSGVARDLLAREMIFVSHETYTPARGGSASAEIHALRTVFGESADRIVIANTKGFTGHAMGAGIEDVVAVKALETGVVPPVANFKEIDPELGPLNLSRGGAYPVEYALRLGAGFGSQISMTLLRRANGVAERPRPNALGYAYRIADPVLWDAWLKQMTGHADGLEVVHRTLRIRADAARDAKPAAAPVAVAAPAPQPVAAAPAVQAPVAKPAAAPKQPVRHEPAPAPAPAPVVAAAPAADSVAEHILALVVEKTGYPREMLDLDLDLEADLGIDTVKQAEMFAAIREHYNIPRDPNLKLRDYPTLTRVLQFVRERRPDLAAAPIAPVVPVAASTPIAPPAAVPAAPVAAAPVADVVAEHILSLVVEKTGYPREMLDFDLDLEADLGIDTVKQAEMFAAIREHYEIPRDPNLKLRDYPTLARVIQFVRERRPELEAPAAAPASAAVAAHTLAPQAMRPASAPATAAQAVPPAPAPATAADPIRDKVLDIVAEKTGYPKDMLDLDLDLEADLGIDTVKQAEMFASVRGAFGIARDQTLKLRDFPTIGHVIRFAQQAQAPAPVAASVSEPEPAAATAEAARRIPRRVPVPVLRPPLAVCAENGVTIGAGKRILVVPDRGGAAEQLTEKLQALGATVVGPEAEPGPIDGVYWLPALDDEGDLQGMSVEAWRQAIDTRVKAMYRTMRPLYGQIAAPGTFLVSATRLGGRHGYDDAGASAPLGGAVTGFTKAYKRERPDVLIKAVDFAPAYDAGQIADLLIAETLRDPGAFEIGYADGERWTIGLEERAAGNGHAGLELNRETVFVVTGAAGSIVSAITADLAAASGGTFHLLDIVPEPDAADPDLMRFENDREGLKRDLFARMQARGERATPALVEKQMAQFERAQAVCHAIEAVRSAGGTAFYYSVDLASGDAVASVMERVRQRSGRIDVLLHAAGVDRSHPLKDKEQREFDVVFDVKSDGCFHLLRAIADVPPATVVFFSSIAGRFGNAAQTDYSSANDLMCKIASSFRRTHPGTRAIAIDWTAWGGIGMATRGSIPKVMEMAGIEILPPEVGIPWVRKELTAGGPSGEVVVAGELGVLLQESHAAGGLEPASLVRGVMTSGDVRANLNGRVTFETTLDPTIQPFLHDHAIDGTPVLPGVMGLEAFAEAALAVAPGWHLRGLEAVDFAAPFKFYRSEPRAVTVEAQFDVDAGELAAQCRLIGTRRMPNQHEPAVVTHFTGRVRLSRLPEPAAAGPAPVLDGVAIDAASIYQLYFHGPAYQVLKRAWCSNGAAIGELAASLPDNHQPNSLPLAVAPRLLELCFQTAGIWEMAVLHRMGLPHHVDSITLHPMPAEPAGPMYAVVTPDQGGESFRAEVVDAEGHRYLTVTGYRTVSFQENVEVTLVPLVETAMA